MENKYHVKHKRQNLTDWQKDVHRFQFWYQGEKEAQCVSGLDVFFDDNDVIPDDVKISVQEYILHLMDTKENTWSVPRGAQKIADAYCAEEFY